MAEKEPLKITQLPAATVTEDGNWLVFSTASATYKIKVSDFMIQFTKVINQSISDEITNRKEADNTITKSLQTEADTRAKADTSLSTSLNEEVNARQNADTSLQKSIDAEVSAREKADNTLQSNIGSEVKERQSADNTLQSNIDNETKSRTSADETLQKNIDTEKSQRLLNVDSLRTDINKCKKVFEYLNPTDTTYLIRHDLSTKDFLINVYSINGKDLNPTIERLDGDNVQLTFEEVPSDFRVVIFAINEWTLNKLAFNLPI